VGEKKERKFRGTERVGLYIMVFITWVNSCQAVDKLDYITDLIEKTPIP
jgi:hypothetical protein